MDTCGEIPYENLNTIQVSVFPGHSLTVESLSTQNPNFKHGGNYYTKGIFSSGPQVDVAEILVSRLPELSKTSGATLTVAFELFPTKKVLSVPTDATAHIRGPQVNVLLLGA